MNNKTLYSRITEINERVKEIDNLIKSLNREKSDLLTEKESTQNKLSQKRQDGGVNYDTSKFSWSNKVNQLLKEQFKLSQFRPLQLKTINTTIDNQDCILIKPTGGGKSLCYQLPALLGGFTLVVSPLISLIQDQMLISEKYKISCCSIDSNCPVKTQNLIYKAMENDPLDQVQYQLIFVTPEKVAKSKKFMKSVERAVHDGRLKRIVIDEVHCCSQWGHDFRPDYKQLHIFKSQFTSVPILGLTATASDRVVDDMRNILNLDSKCLVYRDNYNRPNLFYEIRFLTGEEIKSDEICKMIKNRFSNQSGIVYCYSQRDCEIICGDLVSFGIKAGFYHANLPYDQRKLIHSRWLDEEYKVIVATVAFGMGIDKPNVRFVLHTCMSKSLDNYYQESGRAGRDGKKAICILLWKLSDYFRLGSNLFTEKMGCYNLNKMMNFAIDVDVCKRKYLAEIFDYNQYSTRDCDKMCSVCCPNQSSELVEIDITEVFKLALKIIQGVKLTKNPNITAFKLINELKDGLKSYKTQLIAKYKSLDWNLFMDLSVSHLIKSNYLRQDFHFGSFKNFVYILPYDGEKKNNSDASIKIKILVRKSNENKSSPLKTDKSNNLKRKHTADDKETYSDDDFYYGTS